MSSYEEELEGREFDWFAIDSEGNIGLFSTAGEGSIPSLVVESYAEHDNISELLDSPSWGNSEVWSDYAALGFYVFDWNLHGGPYKREREPTCSMGTELKSKLVAMSSIPTLLVKFTKLKEIAGV